MEFIKRIGIFIILSLSYFIFTQVEVFSQNYYEYLNVDNFKTTGNASRYEGNRKMYKLSDAINYLAAGKIEYNTSFNLLEEKRFVFFANFGVETDYDDETNADGIAFVLHKNVCKPPADPNNCIGKNGHGMGYAPNSPLGDCSETPFSPSIAIEFDTYFNHNILNNVPAHPNAGDQLWPDANPDIYDDRYRKPHISFVKNSCPLGGINAFDNLLYHYQLNEKDEQIMYDSYDDDDLGRTRWTPLAYGTDPKNGIEDGKFHCIEIIWEPTSTKLTVIVDGGPQYDGWKSYVFVDLASLFGTDIGDVRLSITGASGELSSQQLVYFGNEVDIRPDATICYGDTVKLASAKRISYNPLQSTETIEWSPKDGLDDPHSLTPSARPEASTKYRLRLIRNDGQVAEDEVDVTVKGKPKEYFVKNYGGTYQFNGSTIEATEEINGLLRTPDCGYLMSCQSARNIVENGIHYVKKAQLIKTNCDGKVEWSKLYYKQFDQDDDGEIHLCAAKICNIFDYDTLLHFDVGEENKKYYIKREHLGYVFAGQMDYSTNPTITQMNLVYIDTLGIVKGYINFPYSGTYGIDFGSNFVKQLTDESIFVIGNKGAYPGSSMPEHFVFSQLKLNAAGQFNRHQNLNNKMFYTIQKSGYYLDAKEFIETSDGDIIIIGNALKTTMNENYKSFIIKIKNESGYTPQWAYFFDIDNKNIYTKSIVEDNIKKNSYYLLSTTGDAVYLMNIEEAGSNINFSAKYFNIEGATSHWGNGQIINTSPENVAITYQLTKNNNSDLYVSYLKKDMNGNSNTTYAYNLPGIDKVYNLLGVGFGGFASGIESNFDMSQDLRLITLQEPINDCAEKFAVVCSPTVVNHSEMNISLSFFETNTLYKKVVKDETITITPEEECSKEPCYCDKEFITPIVKLKENTATGNCCYEISYLTKQGACPVDKVVYEFFDEQGQLVNSYTKVCIGIMIGGRWYFGENAHEICIAESIGKYRLNIKYQYQENTYECENNFDLGCKCSCEDYKLEKNMSIELVPVSDNGTQCCYDVFIKNSNPCGILNEVINLRYHNSIAPNAPYGISFSPELGWTLGPIGGSPYTILPIYSPANKRIISNGERIKIGRICYMKPEEDPINYPQGPEETISFIIGANDCDKWDFNINCDKNCCESFDNTYGVGGIYVEEATVVGEECCFDIHFKYNSGGINPCNLYQIDLEYPSGDIVSFNSSEIITDLTSQYITICIPNEQKESLKVIPIKLIFKNILGNTICEKQFEIDNECLDDQTNCCEEGQFLISCDRESSTGDYKITINRPCEPDNCNCEIFDITINGNLPLGSNLLLPVLHTAGCRFEDGKFIPWPITEWPLEITVPSILEGPLSICFNSFFYGDLADCCRTFDVANCIVGTGNMNSFKQNEYENIKIEQSDSLSINVIYMTPNPAENETILNFNANISSKISVDIYDAKGAFIKNIIDNNCKAGINSIPISTKSLPNGKYFICLHEDNKIYSTQLIIIK